MSINKSIQTGLLVIKYVMVFTKSGIQKSSHAVQEFILWVQHSCLGVSEKSFYKPEELLAPSLIIAFILSMIYCLELSLGNATYLHTTFQNPQSSES